MVNELGEQDFIRIYEDVITKEQCGMVIEHYEKLVSLNKFKDRKEQTNDNDHMIKDQSVMLDEYVYSLQNTEDMFTHLYGDEGFVPSLFHRFQDYVSEFNILGNGQNFTSLYFKLQKTQPRDGSGYHIWHFENGGVSVQNRIGAWILYLNDVEEGGETEFLYYGKRIKPTAGTLVVWPAGFTHTHRGNPPFSNEKYIMTGWLERI